MVCTPYRLQCKTLHFPMHKFPMHATQNVQMQSNWPRSQTTPSWKGVWYVSSEFEGVFFSWGGAGLGATLILIGTSTCSN